MIERCPFKLHVRIRESLQERYEGGRFSAIEAQDSYIGMLRAESATAVIVKLHHLVQRQQRSIVKIRRSQFDIPQAGRFEGPVNIDLLVPAQVRRRRNK